jgi:uncharacterized protein YjbJ (UPF0337 family)
LKTSQSARFTEYAASLADFRQLCVAQEVPLLQKDFGKSQIIRRNTMKSSTKDQAEGTLHELKGKIKEVAGKLSDNPELEAEGTGEKIAGKVQEKIGQVKKVLGN